MRPRRFLLLALLIPALAASPAPTTVPTSPLLAEAHRILANVKETQYTHKTAIDEQAGSYHCDCSGLLCYLLQRASPEHYKLIPYTHRHRPLAIDFYEAFSAAPFAGTQRTPGTLPTWQRILTLKDAHSGDVIAWRKVNQTPGDNTGHVILLDSTPTPDGPNVFKITVIDSTSSPHADDTRRPDQTGVGRGTLWLKVDDDGAPAGFRWKSNGTHFTTLPIAIGRPLPAVAPDASNP